MKKFISEAPKDSEEFNKYTQAVLDFIEGEYKKENPDAVFSDEKVLAAGGSSNANDGEDDEDNEDNEDNEENGGSESSDAEMNGDLELNLDGKKDNKTKHIIPKDSIELLHEAQAKQKQEEEASRNEENSEKEDGSNKKPQVPHFNDEYLSSMDWTKVGKLPLSSYDPIKREPRFVNSEASCFYELVSNN